MTTELVRTDVPADFDKQMRMAQVYAESNLLPAHLRGKPANVLIILAGARSLNVSAFWALQSMHVIEGKLSLSAELMRGLAIRAGHRVKIIKRDMDEAVVEIKRADSDEPYRASFTWKEAQDAGLQNKDNWKKYRRAMLVARATSIAMRDECPDVLYGVIYTPDELGAIEGEDGSIEVPADTPTAEEVKPMEGDDLRLFVSLVASATPENLVTLAKRAMDQASLGVETQNGTVQTELINRMKRLVDDPNATEDDIKWLWKFAAGLGLLDTMTPAVKTPGAEPELVTYREAFGLKMDMIKNERERLLADQQGEPVDAEVIEDPDAAAWSDDRADEIDTPHAERVREEARDSWGD